MTEPAPNAAPTEGAPAEVASDGAPTSDGAPASGAEASRQGVRTNSAPTTTPFLSDGRVLPVLVIAALIVHARVVGATFTGDDFRHLFESEALPFGRFLLRTNAGHFMAVHNVLFVLLHHAVHLYAVPYYALELVTHLVNVALFYKLLRRIGCSLELSTVVAFLWGIAPVHQGTMRWFSVYQAVLTTTTTLVAMLELARAIENRRPMRTKEIVVATLALWTGAATVGGGTVIALLFPIAAWLTLPKAAAPARTAAIFAPVALIGFVVPRLVADTTPALVPAIAPLLGALLAYGAGALAAGPALTVTESGVGLLGKMSLEVPIAVGAVIGLALAAVVIVGFVRGNAEQRLFIVGMFVFAGAQYGAVAVARSWFAYTHPIAWLATRDRYHYSQGLLMMLGIAASVRYLPFPTFTRSRTLRWLMPAGAALVVLDAATAHFGDANGEGASRNFMASLSVAIRNAARRLPQGADLYLFNEDFNPVAIDVAMGMQRWQFPGIGGYWAIDYGPAPFEGHRVRFVERNQTAVADIRANVEPDMAALFVTPEEATRARVTVRELPELQAIRDTWWNAQDPELRAQVAAAMRQDDSAAGQLRRAIQQDPQAMEAFRRALERDPAAMEALRREMAKQAEQAKQFH